MSVAISNNNNNNNIPSSNQDRPLQNGLEFILNTSRPSNNQRGRPSSMRTLLDLLTVDKMDGLDHPLTIQSDGGEQASNSNSNSSSSSRWRVLKERLGLRIVGCCGVDIWRFGSSPEFPEGDYDDIVVEQNDIVVEQNDIVVVETSTRENNEEIVIDTRLPMTNSMAESRTNLATALAAERDYRATNEAGGDETPSRVSLMRLLEETAEGGGVDGVVEEEEEEVEVVGSDRVCCVCMGRKKGAALIPCGHTYCRVCSREVWLNRGSCPLCNQPILEILDIF